MRLTIRKKLLGGFGIVLILLVAMGGSAYFLVNSLVEDQGEVTDNLSQTKFMAEREIDHLVWMNNLADTIILGQEFTGGLEYDKCNLGQWYYDFIESEEYKNLPPEAKKL